MNDVSRRDFLRRLGAGSVAVAASGYVLSTWAWDGPAAAATAQPGQLGPPPPGRTLVVVELAGGNDGLNTVVPYSDPTYRSLRPTLGVTNPIPLDDEIGLHPSLAHLAARYKSGQVAIVEGVGYSPPNLSHFESLATWWTAQRPSSIGWLGSYLDGTVGYDDPLTAIAIGSQAAPALVGQQSFATTIADATGLQPRLPYWAGDVDTLLASWDRFAPARIDTTSLAGQVERAIGLTVKARGRLDQVLRPDSSTATGTGGGGAAGYGQSTVVASLAVAAQLIRSPLAPHVVYITGVGDFDVHEGEAQRQPTLLSDVDQALEGFFTALGDDARGVLVMTTSEFGRRPAENGSGTDHGTANPHFLIGPAVKGGRYGEPPSLTSLDDTGNVVPSVDFRSLYATGLSWLGVQDTETVLGGQFGPVPVFA